jgi:hypothetical protein
MINSMGVASHQPAWAFSSMLSARCWGESWRWWRVVPSSAWKTEVRGHSPLYLFHSLGFGYFFFLDGGAAGAGMRNRYNADLGGCSVMKCACEALSVADSLQGHGHIARPPRGRSGRKKSQSSVPLLGCLLAVPG